MYPEVQQRRFLQINYCDEEVFLKSRPPGMSKLELGLTDSCLVCDVKYLEPFILLAFTAHEELNHGLTFLRGGCI